jgi:hypothetical protein
MNRDATSICQIHDDMEKLSASSLLLGTASNPGLYDLTSPQSYASRFEFLWPQMRSVGGPYGVSMAIQIRWLL